MHIRCQDGVVEFLYEDGSPLITTFTKNAESVHVVRNSHIEPVDSGIQFKIVWEPWIQPFIGEAETVFDDAGHPFFTKAAAEAYERAILESDEFVQARSRAPALSGN